jgi:hypothetical protein
MIAELFLFLIYPKHVPHYKLNSAMFSLLPFEMLYGPLGLENQHNKEGKEHIVLRA